MNKDTGWWIWSICVILILTILSLHLGNISSTLNHIADAIKMYTGK